MKRILIRVAIVVFSAMALWRLGCVHAVVVGNDYETAIQVGARAKVVFRVVDDGGNPVRDARVDVGFWLPWNDRNGADGVTDSAGMFTVRGVSVGEMVWTVEKYGYYSSRATYHFFEAFPHKEDCVRFGRWQPYGAVREVVLKRKKNPVPMLVRIDEQDQEITLPDTNTAVGFDLLKWDLCPPHGGGETSDLQIGIEGGGGYGRVVLALTNALDGISLQESGTQSLFRSRYRADAPDIDYAKSWSREFRRKNCGLQALEDNEYLFLRIRTKADGDGKLSGARYAKI